MQRKMNVISNKITRDKFFKLRNTLNVFDDLSVMGNKEDGHSLRNQAINRLYVAKLSQVPKRRFALMS